jgi:hypothetical protein
LFSKGKEDEEPLKKSFPMALRFKQGDHRPGKRQYGEIFRSTDGFVQEPFRPTPTRMSHAIRT